MLLKTPIPVGKSLLGVAKLGWLRTLNTFAPAMKLTRSVTLKFLFADMSVSKYPGPRKKLRERFPKSLWAVAFPNWVVSRQAGALRLRLGPPVQDVDEALREQGSSLDVVRDALGRIEVHLENET